MGGGGIVTKTRSAEREKAAFSKNIETYTDSTPYYNNIKGAARPSKNKGRNQETSTFTPLRSTSNFTPREISFLDIAHLFSGRPTYNPKSRQKPYRKLRGRRLISDRQKSEMSYFPRSKSRSWVVWGFTDPRIM